MPASNVPSSGGQGLPPSAFSTSFCRAGSMPPLSTHAFRTMGGLLSLCSVVASVNSQTEMEPCALFAPSSKLAPIHWYANCTLTLTSQVCRSSPLTLNISASPSTFSTFVTERTPFPTLTLGDLETQVLSNSWASFWQSASPYAKRSFWWAAFSSAGCSSASCPLCIFFCIASISCRFSSSKALALGSGFSSSESSMWSNFE
mmetsp:Transcript_69573/g.203608  ORF Transcript_69573/g.203608 Transcript_69573/m.203608 type:complete len:202 (+) Transcript_69573:219-824(+)